MRSALKIIALCILAAVLFGVVHDQVTARICVEYFTIGHPNVLGTDSPTLLGLFWGVAATWWVGLLLGVPLAFVSLSGPGDLRTASSLVRPVAILLVVMAVGSLVAGVTGYFLASEDMVVLIGPIASSVPEDRHVAFITDLWAHSASYLFGFAGGLVLIWRVRRSRRQAPGGVVAVTSRS